MHKEVADMLHIGAKAFIAHQTNTGEKLGVYGGSDFFSLVSRNARKRL